MNKKEFVNQYIREADEIIASGNVSDAKRFQQRVVGVFYAEIENLTRGLDNYSPGTFGGYPDYLGDVKLLKEKLQNHLLNLQDGYFMDKNISGTQISLTQEVNNNIAISFEQAIATINNIPDDVLTDDEKHEVTGLLAAVVAEKNKRTRWDKVKDVLKWLGDKTVDVGIAVLPYVLETIK